MKLVICFHILFEIMNNKKTGIINDTRMLKHKSKRSHPEKPKRVEKIMQRLEQTGIFEDERVDFISSYERQATNQEIKYVYPQKYIKYISNLWSKDSHRHDITVLDTYFCAFSQKAARLATGGVLLGIDRVMDGSWNNGFAVVRPPGHHSGVKQTLNGFCIFNGVAIGARYLQHKYGKKKIAILDWDVHRGDGTHHLFETDPNILFISIHRYDHGTFYPAGQQGNFYNCGKKEGEGSKINIPLNHYDIHYKKYECQAPGDNEYVYIYNRIVQPILREFSPQFLIISSGFDASRYDPLGQCTVTPNGFFYMARRLTQLNIPLIGVLEGGYNVEQSALSAEAVIQAFIGEKKLPQPIQKISFEDMTDNCFVNEVYHKDFDETIEHHSRYWKSLQSHQLVQYTKKIKSNKKKLFGFIESQSSSSSSEQDEQNIAKKQQQETIDQKYLAQVNETETKVEQVYQNTKSKEVFIKELNEVNHKDQEEYSKQKLKESWSSEQNSQFCFAVGHMQRFKNFSLNNPKIHKWAYPSEAKFYQSNFPETAFAPKFFGRQGEYIVLQNLLYKLQDHVVADFKLSRHSKKPGITSAREQKQLKKEEHSTSGKYGFRLSGFTTPTYKEGGLLISNETFLQKVFQKIVTADNKEYFCDFLTKMADTLKQGNRKYFNSSIFMARGKNKSEIKWIDFHYWCEDCETYDEDLVEGLCNIRKFVSQVDTASTQ